MTTIVNNPPATENSSGPIGMIVGLLVLIVLGYLVFVYGVPMLRQIGGSPQINVPSKINVNVTQPTP